MRLGDVSCRLEIYYNTLRAAGFESIVPYRTALDMDNPAAFALLDDWEGTPDFTDRLTGEPSLGMRSDWMQQTISRHLQYFREGFIVMWNGEAPTGEYWDPDVELSILNEKRFGLSFPPPFPRSTEIDARRVNSILLPTLPTTKIWSARRPWN